MKALSAIGAALLFGLAFAAAGANIPYKEAVKKNAKDGKPVLIEFYAKWCIPCLEMEKTVFADAAVIKELRANFHFARVDTEASQELFCEGETLPIYDCMSLWEIDGVPAFAFVNKDGNLLHTSTGDYGIDEFLALLRAVKADLDKER